MSVKIVVSNQDLSKSEGGQYKLSVDVNWNGEPKLLWTTFPESFKEFVNIETYDWVVAGLLIPAMKAGANLVIKGNVSPRLYLAAKTDLQKIFKTQNKSLNNIQVSVDKVCRSDGNTSFFTGVGFSAGVDSLSSLAILEQDLATRPTHLVTLNVGAMGPGAGSQAMLKKYSQRLESVSEALGFSSIAMDSNLSDFYKGLTFQATHTVRTAAAILSLGATFKDYYYSSGFVYEAIGVKATDDMSCADPILLPLFSTESVQFHALGTYLTRLEKVRLVCDYPRSYSILDVCVGEVSERLDQKKPNCSKCRKCGCQLISLDLLGALDRYEEVFDLDEYKSSRRSLMYNLAMAALEGNRPNETDVILLAQENNRLKKFNFYRVIKIAKISWKLRDIISRLVARDFCAKSTDYP